MSIVSGIRQLTHLGRDYEAQFFKPQPPTPPGDPEPPAWLSSLLSSGSVFYPLQSESLEALHHFSATLNAKALNPQPLPPRDFMLSDVATDLLDEAALNPQPLPPKEDESIFNGSISTFGDEVVLNPQPLPPKPSPDPGPWQNLSLQLGRFWIVR